jgi:hypothetical protein
MSTSVTLDKTDFIKFNVSPTFKKLVAKQAKNAGLTLSELGRMLFGWYAHGLIKRPTIEDLAKEAKRNYEKGKGVTFSSAKDAIRYLDKIK